MIRNAARLRWVVPFLFFAGRAAAADLELRYAALERLIAEQLFTQDGRRYVRGTPETRCQFAYLEAPRLSAADGRLKITAKFSGRSAMDVLGRCMGMGDSFDLTILAVPVARKGAIAMENVQVSTVKDSYYIRRVRAALTESFAKEFKIDVRDQAKRLLEQPSGTSSYKQELADFDLSAVRVTPEALVLVVEFKLVVK
ncbi:MAG TPA: hypothetical protein VGG72_15305 [Bryobacteraceae bacterium]|jgi:hypothetical protein